ncbi:MAG: cellulose biosynthesis cyclic di-GMP-binding regulatory protein BcsB [Candidatus Aenigmatarchaeota archaeon]
MKNKVVFTSLAIFLLFFISFVYAGNLTQDSHNVEKTFTIQLKEKKKSKSAFKVKRFIRLKVNLMAHSKMRNRNKHITHKTHEKKYKKNYKEKTSKIMRKNLEKQLSKLSYTTAKYSFRKIDLLSGDMVLRGVSPAYDFYIPTYNNLIKAIINLKITIPPYLRKDSSVTILVDNIPQYTITMQNANEPIKLDIKPKKGKNFVKISIRGNLRLSHNICEDIFSDKPYIVIHDSSTITFLYKQANDIKTFLMDYGRQFCIENTELLPLVYYISKTRTIPPVFHWGINDNCQKIIKISPDTTKLDGKTLYITKSAIKALQYGYESLIFGKSIQITQVKREKSHKYNKVSFKELGIKTSTIKGISNISFYIPFNLASFGGMPDTLYLRLNFAHTPAHQKDKMELRVYLNNALIKTLPLKGYGTKEIDIKIPSRELSYGYNSLVVNLVDFISSDNCFGAVTQSVLTVFDNSYFYWNSVNKRVRTISDFFKIIHGRVGLQIEDKNMMPLAVKLLNMLGNINKSIKSVVITNKKYKNYDYFISFVKPNYKKGLFEVYDPVEKKVIFSAKYELPFVYFNLKDTNPLDLQVSQYGNPNISALANKYRIEDYLNLHGNIAVISENYLASFETINKLRVRYEGYRGIGYYWMKYKLIIIILLSIPIIYFLIYTYKKLTRRVS